MRVGQVAEKTVLNRFQLAFGLSHPFALTHVEQAASPDTHVLVFGLPALRGLCLFPVQPRVLSLRLRSGPIRLRLGLRRHPRPPLLSLLHASFVAHDIAASLESPGRLHGPHHVRSTATGNVRRGSAFDGGRQRIQQGCACGTQAAANPRRLPGETRRRRLSQRLKILTRERVCGWRGALRWERLQFFVLLGEGWSANLLSGGKTTELLLLLHVPPAHSFSHAFGQENPGEYLDHLLLVRGRDVGARRHPTFVPGEGLIFTDDAREPAQAPPRRL